MSNTPATKEQKPRFSVAISTPNYQNMINNTLRDPKRAQRFIAAITSAVAVSPALQECTPSTILSGALLGESLGLSPSPQLGQYYLVPFKNKAKYDRQGNVVKPETTDAVFVLGYKGYIQLALRSGYYKRLNVIAVKSGELVRYDPLTEEVVLNINQDELAREASATVGYLAMFEYLNGFQKTIYWSKEKMIAHADRYSAAFSAEATTINGKGGKVYRKVSFHDYEAGNYPKSDEWLYSSFWYKDFDAMAFKTMLRQLISKWGIMSVDLQKAFEADVVEEGDFDYVQDASMELPSPEIEALPDGPAAIDAAPSEGSTEEQVSLGDV